MKSLISLHIRSVHGHSDHGADLNFVYPVVKVRMGGRRQSLAPQSVTGKDRAMIRFFIYCWHAHRIAAVKVGYAREPLLRMARYANKYGVAYDPASWRCWGLPNERLPEAQIIETRCHNALLASGMTRLELPGPFDWTSQQLFRLMGHNYADAVEIVDAAVFDRPLTFYPDGTRRFSEPPPA